MPQFIPVALYLSNGHLLFIYFVLNELAIGLLAAIVGYVSAKLAVGTARSVKDDTEDERKKPGSSAYRLSWSSLLARVFQIDVFICPACSGKTKIIAFVAAVHCST